MRLLTQDENGSLVLRTFDGVSPPPPYAILSHTWLPDSSEEVSLQDLQAGIADHKPGYDKVRFCAKQAAADGLRYFWIDTCSVDQTSSAELTEAINSMFRWYRESAKCYVYLTDVPNSTHNKVLCGSRWFTRGWTLQELIAPKVVEFFAADGSRLGDRSSLERSISEATGMTVGALRGYPLSDFSIEERFRWAADRRTKKPEDKAYSLLGIFDVSMSAIYGEGEMKAMGRLRKQIDRQNPQANSSHASTSMHMPSYYFPFAQNRRFVGRRHELQELRQKLLIDKECQKIAIVGLGGIGKTQIALEFAQSVKRERLDYSVFWAPAVSLESFEQACREIARILQTPQAVDNRQDVKVLVQRHLSQSAGKWLLIVDNADDMDVMFGAGSSRGVVDFLPENDTGVTVFTSRRTQVAQSLVGSDVLEVGKLSEDEAVAFLMTSLAQNCRTEDGATKQLVADLDCLPLAIAQAAAYINTNKIAVSNYLDVIRKTDADLIAVMSREFRDSTRYRQSANAVATTWVVSLDQIQRESNDAADLLSFISCIEWKGIPLCLLPTFESEARTTDAIGTICSYGFMARRNEKHLFDMHRLVHLAIRIWLNWQTRGTVVRQVAMKHVAAIFPSDEDDNRLLWQEYLPHAFYLMRPNDDNVVGARAELALRVGRCLYQDGRISEAVMWLMESCQWRGEHLPKDDAGLLLSQRMLAQAYLVTDRTDEAIELLSHVAGTYGRLPEDNPDRLALQRELAAALLPAGKAKKAMALLNHAATVQSNFKDDDPDRVASQHMLASALLANRQYREGLALLEHVVTLQNRSKEEDSNLLASQHMLAVAYWQNGQSDTAIDLLEHVVAIKKRIYSERHPSRTASEEQLEYIRLVSGCTAPPAIPGQQQISEAVMLLEHVIEVESS